MKSKTKITFNWIKRVGGNIKKEGDKGEDFRRERRETIYEVREGEKEEIKTHLIDVQKEMTFYMRNK